MISVPVIIPHSEFYPAEPNLPCMISTKEKPAGQRGFCAVGGLDQGVARTWEITCSSKIFFKTGCHFCGVSILKKVLPHRWRRSSPLNSLMRPAATTLLLLWSFLPGTRDVGIFSMTSSNRKLCAPAPPRQKKSTPVCTRNHVTSGLRPLSVARTNSKHLTSGRVSMENPFYSTDTHILR